jgi:hypothetical protein
MPLRTDIDATYPDDPARPGVKAHKRDHDALAAQHNRWEDVDPDDLVDEDALDTAIATRAPSEGIAQSAVAGLVAALAAKATPAQIDAAIAALSGTFVQTPDGDPVTAGTIVTQDIDDYATAGWVAVTVILKSGTAQVESNLVPPGMRVAVPTTITELHARAGTAPTGGALIVRVKGDGVTLASVTIADGATSGSLLAQSIAVAAGVILTFDITNIGATIAGADVALDLIAA